MKPVVMMSYKDYNEVWMKLQREASLDQLIRELPEGASEEEVRHRNTARVGARLTGAVMARVCLELAGMLPNDEDDSWKEREDLLNANELTDRLIPIVLCKMMEMPVELDESLKVPARTVELIQKMPSPVFIFWMNEWLGHVNQSMGVSGGEEASEE